MLSVGRYANQILFLDYPSTGIMGRARTSLGLEVAQPISDHINRFCCDSIPDMDFSRRYASIDALKYRREDRVRKSVMCPLFCNCQVSEGGGKFTISQYSYNLLTIIMNSSKSAYSRI